MLPQKEIASLLILISVFLSGSGGVLGGQKQQHHEETVPTLTVCQALSHGLQYDGKIVHIRDQVYGTDEGSWFLGEDCPGIYVTDGKTWPSQIAWTMPTQLTFILHPVDFSFDWEARKKLESKWEELGKRLPDKCIAVTYTGMFEIWTKETSRKKSGDGFIEIPGFGHLNGAPAQLVLKSADD